MKGKKLAGILIMALALMAATPFVSAAALTNAKDIVVGKDGWFFYDQDGSMEDYKGTRMFTNADLLKIKNNLLSVQRLLNSQGREFVIFLAPDKETIYSEYMPDSYGAHPAYTRIDQVYDYLKDDLRVVYPKNELLAAKAAYPQYDLYYRTDSHWNNIGAYIGAQALARELGYSLPDLGSLSIQTDYYELGDLIEDLELEETPRDYTYMLTGFSSNLSYIRDQDEYGNYFWYYAVGAPENTMTIYGDSYSMAMVPYIGQFFENTYLHRFTADKSIVDEEQPSVVVYQVLERFLDELK